jgi:hypothetical protein
VHATRRSGGRGPCAKHQASVLLARQDQTTTQLTLGGQGEPMAESRPHPITSRVDQTTGKATMGKKKSRTSRNWRRTGDDPASSDNLASTSRPTLVHSYCVAAARPNLNSSDADQKRLLSGRNSKLEACADADLNFGTMDSSLTRSAIVSKSRLPANRRDRRGAVKRTRFLHQS